MEIKSVSSNFSQFSNDMWLIAEHNETRIQFEVSQPELLAFARNLVDVAIDCLRKSKQDTENIDEILCSAFSMMENIK